MVHDGDPVAQAHHELHVVLDDQEGLVPAAFSSRISSEITLISVGFTPPAGSSSSRTAGSAMST